MDVVTSIFFVSSEVIKPSSQNPEALWGKGRKLGRVRESGRMPHPRIERAHLFSKPNLAEPRGNNSHSTPRPSNPPAESVSRTNLFLILPFFPAAQTSSEKTVVWEANPGGTTKRWAPGKPMPALDPPTWRCLNDSAPPPWGGARGRASKPPRLGGPGWPVGRGERREAACAGGGEAERGGHVQPRPEITWRGAGAEGTRAGSSPEERRVKWGGRGGSGADNGECAAYSALASSPRPRARGGPANGWPSIAGGLRGAGRGRRAGRGTGLGLSGRRRSGKSGLRRFFPVSARPEHLRVAPRSLGHVGACARVPWPAVGALAGYSHPASAGALCRLPFQGSQSLCFSWAAPLPFRWSDPRAPRFHSRGGLGRSGPMCHELDKLRDFFFFLTCVWWYEAISWPHFSLDVDTCRTGEKKKRILKGRTLLIPKTLVSCSLLWALALLSFKPFLETYRFGMLKWPGEQRREGNQSTLTAVSGKRKHGHDGV